MEDKKDKHCGDVCTDERFSMIARVKSELMRSTNIETDKKEMEVIDSILYRFWQKGWLQLIDCEIASKNRSQVMKQLSTDDMITPKALKERGWEFIDGEIDLLDLWEKKQDGFWLQLSKYSNTPGRDWNVHVDNQDRQSVAGMDVSLFSHIDNLLELLKQ